MIEKETPINQTQFSFEEPIFENQAVYQEKLPTDEVKKSKNKNLLIIITSVAGVVVILLGLFIAIGMKNGNGFLVEPEPELIVPKELSPLEQRIQDARDLLDIADPAKQDLAFPPVDLQIRLDPKVR
jgi:hypothetical protein